MAAREGSVVVGLVRSSSRVADLNSLQEQQQQQQRHSDKEPEYFDRIEIDTKKKKKKKKKQFVLTSCFYPQTGHPQQQQRSSRSKGLWPSSPSHIMSRLLLDIGGDQSPAHHRAASCRARRSSSYSRPDFFSGPLAAGSNRKDFSKRDEANDEPVSPKVTCMGTVKVPKHCNAGPASKASPPRSPRAAPPVPSSWTKTKPRGGGGGDGGCAIDLSRFGGTCSAAPPLDLVMTAEDTRRKSTASPSSPSCRKADEVCIWKRRALQYGAGPCWSHLSLPTLCLHLEKVTFQDQTTQIQQT